MEHPAEQQAGHQILGGVQPLGVGQPDQPAHTGAVGQIPADVGPLREVGLGVAHMDHRHHAQRGGRGPHLVPVGVAGRASDGRAPQGVEEERPGAPFPAPLQFGHCVVQVGEVDGGHRVKPVALVPKLLGEKVVAPLGGDHPIIRPQVVELLPIAAGVHQAVVDAHRVHPLHPLGRGGVMTRMEDDRPARFLGPFEQLGQQLRRTGPSLRGQHLEQVAGDGVGQMRPVVGNLIGPLLHGVNPRRVPRDLPVSIHIDDHAPSLSGSPPARPQSTRAMNQRLIMRLKLG